MPQGFYSRPSIEERFWSKVAKSWWDGCWIWTAGVTGRKYGSFHIGPGKKNTLAHIWSYVQAYGPVPKGLVLDHVVCNNKRCVRPDHLVPTTVRENSLREPKGPAAINAHKTHCVHGHLFDEKNTVIYRDGDRRCRTCRNEWVRTKRARDKRGKLDP